jgi:DNA-binding response OmpR family regulator
MKNGRPNFTLGIVTAEARIRETTLFLLQRERIEYRLIEGIDLSVRLANVANVHAVLLDWIDDKMPFPLIGKAASKICYLPTIIAVSSTQLITPDLWRVVDDFILNPWSDGELSLRINLLLNKRAETRLITPGAIDVGGLFIDTKKYDVFVEGKQVLLTFKEYELLKLLAMHPGRVFSRDALLEQIWGYQYFGGTRTVDVHVRRLRSKIDDATHSFIETVWNVGYRFRPT